MRFALASWIAIAAYAQNATPNDLQQRIDSVRRASTDAALQLIVDPRPVYKAWAAVLIRQNGDPWFLHQELLAALGDPTTLASRGRIESNERLLHLAILDTLIQLKAEIPPEIGEALLSPYPAQATILLYGRGCQDVRISTFILDNSQPDEPWLVAAGCLSVNRRGPVELLQRFQVSAQVKVFDPDRGEGNRFRPIGGLAGAGANGTVALGWPEIHGYRLMMGSDASSGATLLMPGIHAVYYERGPDSQPNPPSHDRHEYILDFLTNLLHVNKKALGLDTHPSAQLHWLGAQRYRSDLEAFVADQQRRYAALLSELVRQRAVTEEDAAGSRLKLDITIVDQRSKRVDSIPTLGIGDHPN